MIRPNSGFHSHYVNPDRNHQVFHCPISFCQGLHTKRLPWLPHVVASKPIYIYFFCMITSVYRVSQAQAQTHTHLPPDQGLERHARGRWSSLIGFMGFHHAPFPVTRPFTAVTGYGELLSRPRGTSHHSTIRQHPFTLTYRSVERV